MSALHGESRTRAPAKPTTQADDPPRTGEPVDADAGRDDRGPERRGAVDGAGERRGHGLLCDGRKDGHCPQRYNTRPETAETKSRAGRRTIGLPPPLIDLLRAHHVEQARERIAARQLWHDGGWLFADQLGNALNPRTDTKHWKDLLREADVRDARLHDARHTAATVLLILGVPDRAVMEIMGWSHAAMTRRYQHLTGTVRTDIAGRVGGLLWGTAEE